MEESNLINNDNTYNTDMSTSQSTIGGNATTNDKFNKDDLQEVTGGGGGGIVTPPTTIVDGSETSQTTGSLTPILLILGDGTTTPPDDEEPVLLEEDEDTTYNAVLNQSYENMDPTITLESGEVSYCDANYVIAVTETDKNTPISYNSNNLSFSFTNNGNNWCSVEFKSPLDVTDQLKLPLNSDNFPDNSKIIVPVIKCTENTGPERNTTITFNIKNFAISHNIQMNVIQEGVTFVDGPCVLRHTSIDSTGKYNYEILNNPVYYITSSNSFVFMNTNTSEHMLFFGLNKNNNIVGNLTNTLEYYNTLFSADDNNYKCKINDDSYAATKGTAAYITIDQPENKDLNQTITFKYNNITFMKVKYMDNIKYKTTIYICALENLQNYKTDEGYIIYLFNSDIGTSAAIKDTISQSTIVSLRGDNNTDISNGRIVACYRDYFGDYDAINADNIGELNNYTSDDETMYQIKPVQANLSAKDLGRTYNNVYIEDWTGLNVYDYNSSTLKFKGLEKNTDTYVYTIKDNKYVKIGVINFGKELNYNNYIGQYDYYYQSFQASTYNSYWFQYIHCYGDKNDSYYNSEIETDALNSTFKDKQFGTFDLYFVVIYNIDEKYNNNETDVDIANSIINSGKTYKKYQVPSGTYQFTMNNLIALTYHPKDIYVETIKTFSVLYNELNLTKSHYLDNHFYNKYNTYNVIDLNNVCNDINGNIINLNEVCKDLENRIYIFTKENTKLVYIGVISPAHAMTDVIMANWNHYT